MENFLLCFYDSDDSLNQTVLTERLHYNRHDGEKLSEQFAMVKSPAIVYWPETDIFFRIRLRTSGVIPR
jgi:hypothetical protein